MTTKRPVVCRREAVDVGEIRVELTVENGIDPARRVHSVGLVDTGAVGLILPVAWRSTLGPLRKMADVDLETADQRVVAAEICGPVVITLDGFRQIAGETIFVPMEPNVQGGYEPLVGYTVLELCNVVIDMGSHSLVARKYYPLKRLRAA